MKELLFSNGDTLPNIGLGTWLSKSNEVYNSVLEAIRIGYRHIDCAYIYGNEKEIGLALHAAIQAGLVKRDELFITSKLWNSDHAPERVEVAIRKSLESLQLEYLDLYLMHWPIAFKTGHEQAQDASDLLPLDEMPVETTFEAMEKMKQIGLTKHIGVSNFNILKLKKLTANCRTKPEVNQIEIHPYLQQKELVDFCNENGILVTAFSPLGSSHLIKKEISITNEPVILQIARKHNCSAAEVLLAWGMQRGISVIPKSVNAERLRENFKSIRVVLDVNDMKAIATLNRNLRLGTGLYSVLPGGPYTLKSIWDE